MGKFDVKKENKSTILMIHEVEKDNIIVNVDGWRIRVSTAELSEQDKNSLNFGRNVIVEYEGDLKDVFSLKLLPLKSI